MNIGRRFQTKADINIELTGDWDKFGKLSRNLTSDFRIGTLAGSTIAARKFYTAIRKNIKNGGSLFNYPQLSPKYAKKKGRKAEINRLFNYYGHYYRAIKLTSDKWSSMVHIKRGAYNPGTGGNYTINNIAKVLEAGNKKGSVKARPIWNDTYKSLGGGTYVRQTIVRAIKRHFRIKYNMPI